MTLLTALKSSLRWLWGNKGKLGLTIGSALVFAFLLFPFDDLSDLVSGQISTATRNQVYLQFDNMGLSLFPQPGMQLEKVYLETPATSPLSIDELTVLPSIRALLTNKIYGSASARGLFKGDLDVSVSSGGTSEKGATLHRLDLKAVRLNLQDLRQLAKLPIMLKGRLDLETTGVADLAFSEQPDVQLELKVQQFELPPSTVQTQLGDLTLPELKLGQVELKGRLSGGRFLIEKSKIGNPGDDIQGEIKGNLTLNLRNAGAGPQPEFGPYNLEVDLRISDSFKSRAGFFLTLLAPYQEGAESRYRLRVSAAGFGLPPTMSRMR